MPISSITSTPTPIPPIPNHGGRGDEAVGDDDNLEEDMYDIGRETSAFMK